MRDGLDRDAAGTLTQAFWAWLSFVASVVAFGLLVLVLRRGTGVDSGPVFVLATLWSAVVVPFVLYVKGHVVRATWEARPADPEVYLRGLVTVWAVITAGAVLALMSCLVHGAALPGAVLAGVLLAVLVGMRPSSAALGAGITPAES